MWEEVDSPQAYVPGPHRLLLPKLICSEFLLGSMSSDLPVGAVRQLIDSVAASPRLLFIVSTEDC